MQDTAIGLKWHIQDAAPASGQPAVSWIAHLDLPTGTNGFAGYGVRPSLRTFMTLDLSGESYIGFMLGLRYDATPDEHRFGSGILSVTTGKNWTDHFRTFVETYADQIVQHRDGGVLWAWGIGPS